MHKSRPVYQLAMIVLLALVAQSCKKNNGIDNDTILKKPYSLYVANLNGALYVVNSRDTGALVFPVDGYPVHAVLTSAENILMIKENVFLSKDNGANFNITYFKHRNVFGNNNPYQSSQQIIIKATGHDRIYLCSTEGKGIVYSEDNGAKWKIDSTWDGGVTGGNITSFAQLKDGSLYAHAFSKDSLYKRDNKTDAWTHIKATTALPGAGTFYISSFNNELLAVDINGLVGIYHSSDGGVTWAQYPGLPVGQQINAANAPFNQRLLVGTDSAGAYRFDGTGFVPANNGMENYATVYGFVGKDDVYKNETRRAYIYAATSKGLYRSEDGGINWTRSKVGNFTALY